MIKPYYEENGITIYHGDCREILPELEPVDLLLTDPPYPNNAGHFNADIETARIVCEQVQADRKMIFWDERERPAISMPLIAIHIWHRTNTNRPDNYEAIYDYRADGKKVASRVLPFAVIFPGLTGCHEATGHPTQKNEKLIRALIKMTKASTVLDPFAGSGTTGRAAKDLHLKCVLIEKEEKYCEIAVKRLAQGVLDFAS